MCPFTQWQPLWRNSPWSLVHLRETYDDIKEVINLLKCHEHHWILCVDLKMVSFLLGQQRFHKVSLSSLHVGQPRSRETLHPEGVAYP